MPGRGGGTHAPHGAELVYIGGCAAEGRAAPQRLIGECVIYRIARIFSGGAGEG